MFVLLLVIIVFMVLLVLLLLLIVSLLVMVAMMVVVVGYEASGVVNAAPVIIIGVDCYVDGDDVDVIIYTVGIGCSRCCCVGSYGVVAIDMLCIIDVVGIGVGVIDDIVIDLSPLLFFLSPLMLSF